MLIIHARLRIDPAGRASYLREAAVLAATTRMEPGNQSFRFYEAVDTENDLILVEEWLDSAALEQHFGTPHFAAFRAATAGSVVDRDTTLYEVSEARALPLPPQPDPD